MLLLRTLELVMDLGDRLVDQEQSAEDEDDVLPREPEVADGEDLLGQGDEPSGEEDQDHAHRHREREPEVPGLRLLLLGELGGEDRDEDDVVDAEDDLEHEQCDEDRDQVGRESEAEVHGHIVGG